MERVSRPQVVVLVTGLAQLATALLGFPVDVGEPHRLLLMCTGLLGLVCAWRRHHSRLYGAGLAVGYGAIAYAGIAEDELVLHLRAVLVGLVIAFMPMGRRRAGATRPLKGEAR